jgi:hypothetical protein
MKQKCNAKNDFDNSIYLSNYPFENIFQKICPEIFMIFKVLTNTIKGPIHLELFRPFASEVLGSINQFPDKLSALLHFQSNNFEP